MVFEKQTVYEMYW